MARNLSRTCAVGRERAPLPNSTLERDVVGRFADAVEQGDDIAPIPGTKRVSRVEENTSADSIELSAEQIQRLNDLTPAAGERHDEASMSVIDR